MCIYIYIYSYLCVYVFTDLYISRFSLGPAPYCESATKPTSWRVATPPQMYRVNLFISCLMFLFAATRLPFSELHNGWTFLLVLLLLLSSVAIMIIISSSSSSSTVIITVCWLFSEAGDAAPDIHTYIHYITLHYITLHYITLYYITLHYITLHYITLHTLHYITYIHAYSCRYDICRGHHSGCQSLVLPPMTAGAGFPPALVICIYIYIYIERERYIYIYIYLSLSIYIYIYI